MLDTLEVAERCRLRGCTIKSSETYNRHYHCGRCMGSDVTSYMGHYQSDDGKLWYFACKKEDLREEVSSEAT